MSAFHFILAEDDDDDFLLIQKLGINEHFKSISRGVIDTRDLVYFVSVTGFFLFITKIRLEND